MENNDFSLFQYNALLKGIDPIAVADEIKPATVDPEFWMAELTVNERYLDTTEFEDGTKGLSVNKGSDVHNLLTDLACISGLYLEKFLYFDLDTDNKTFVLGIDNQWTEDEKALLDKHVETEGYTKQEVLENLLRDDCACLKVRLQYSNCFMTKSVTGITQAPEELVEAFNQELADSKMSFLVMSYTDVQTSTYIRQADQDLTTFTLPITVIEDTEGAEFDTMALAYSLGLANRKQRNRILKDCEEQGVVANFEKAEANVFKPPSAIDVKARKKRKNKNKAAKKARKRKK